MKNKEEKFVIDNDNKACWALKKIKKHKENIAKKEELAKSQITQINVWLEEETNKLNNKIEHMEGMLFEYAQQLKEQDKKLKTHSLPFGKLQFRKQRPKWHYKDDLLEYAKLNLPNLINVKESVDKRKLKNICEVVNGKVINAETGEIIEGVEVKERGEKFSVKVE